MHVCIYAYLYTHVYVQCGGVAKPLWFCHCEAKVDQCKSSSSLFCKVHIRQYVFCSLLSLALYLHQTRPSLTFWSTTDKKHWRTDKIWSPASITSVKNSDKQRSYEIR